jgi:hypothetical protein
MRIEQSQSLQRTTARRPTQAASGDSRFAEELSGDTATSATTSPQTITTVDNLFLLQEVPDELTGRRRKAMQRGNSMLDRLDDLRIALLTGSLPRGQLEALRHLARNQVDLTGDPELAAIVDDIELRVAVELAKLDAA